MRKVLGLLALLAAVHAADIFYGDYAFEADGPRFNLLPPLRSQHHPRACHASWAFALTTTMATLFNKERKGAFPETVLSPQMIIHTRPENVEFSCAGTPNFNIDAILNQLITKGVSDEGCNNYYADDSRKTTKLAECMDCHNNEDASKEAKCDFVPYRAHKLKSWFKISSGAEDPSQRDSELRQKVLESFEKNGPLVCKLSHSAALFEKRLKGFAFYDEPAAKPDDASWVSLIRYGQHEGKAAIGLATSFGENIGYYGHILLDISEKVNPLDIFSNCYVLEINPVTEYVRYDQQGHPRQHRTNFLSTDKGVKHINRGSAGKGKVNLNQGYRPSSLLGAFNEGIRISSDNQPINWQDNNGRNYVTYSKNQHIPVYCGSCWAQAAISVISDRLNIQRINSGAIFPKINLSVQAVLNCKQGGSCFGGDSSVLFQKAMGWKIPIESCHPYESKNPDNFKCDVPKLCTLPLPGKETQLFPQFSGAKVTKWYRIRGADAMKEELKKGPIACSFEVTEEFVKYARIEGQDKNIWTKNEDFLELNHAISIVGWGIQKDVQYWIARNSWGKEWGYDGYFYMELGKNLLGIESDCSAPEVVFEEFK